MGCCRGAAGRAGGALGCSGGTCGIGTTKLGWGITGTGTPGGVARGVPAVVVMGAGAEEGGSGFMVQYKICSRLVLASVAAVACLGRRGLAVAAAVGYGWLKAGRSGSRSPGIWPTESWAQEAWPRGVAVFF